MQTEGFYMMTRLDCLIAYREGGTIYREGGAIYREGGTGAYGSEFRQFD